MLKKVLRAKAFQNVVGKLLARYVDFVYASSKKIFHGEDMYTRLVRGHPLILGVWHGQFLTVVKMKPSAIGGAVKVMVARHADAEFVAKAYEHWGLGLVRGAGAAHRKRNRGGATALRGAVRALAENNSIVMTADVPPGPARKAGMGIVMLARLSGRPIVPAAVATSRFIALKTWSRFTINLPFSNLAMVLGDPIWVSKNATEDQMETARQLVEAELNRITEKAYALAGADINRISVATGDKCGGSGAQALPEPGLSLKSYRTLTGLARPIAPAILSYREKHGKEEHDRRTERYGFASARRPEGPLLWFHAASVGETNAVLPFIEQLRLDRPDINILLTTGTVTSAHIASRRLPEGCIHQYVPLDVALFVRRFLEHWQPDLALFVESEIWPNLIIETAARKISLVLLNGRMSERSFEKWSARPGLARPLFSRFSLVLAQSDVYADRFHKLGVRKSMAVGNLKIDAPAPLVDPDDLNQLKRCIEARPVILAASTHDNEEQFVIEAHKTLQERYPDMLTIIAPRHPHRAERIAALAEEHGLHSCRRSQTQLPEQDCAIYLADTMGELGLLYSLCELAFIGGSLVSHGGQNPVEAAKHDTAILVGPHWHNFGDVYGALLENGGACEVQSGEELAEMFEILMGDETARYVMMRQAHATIDGLSGALQRTHEIVRPLLPAAPNSTEKRSSARKGLQRAS